MTHWNIQSVISGDNRNVWSRMIEESKEKMWWTAPQGSISPTELMTLIGCYLLFHAVFIIWCWCVLPILPVSPPLHFSNMHRRAAILLRRHAIHSDPVPQSAGPQEPPGDGAERRVPAPQCGGVSAAGRVQPWHPNAGLLRFSAALPERTDAAALPLHLRRCAHKVQPRLWGHRHGMALFPQLWSLLLRWWAALLWSPGGTQGWVILHGSPFSHLSVKVLKLPGLLKIEGLSCGDRTCSCEDH